MEVVVSAAKKALETDAGSNKEDGDNKERQNAEDKGTMSVLLNQLRSGRIWF